MVSGYDAARSLGSYPEHRSGFQSGSAVWSMVFAAVIAALGSVDPQDTFGAPTPQGGRGVATGEVGDCGAEGSGTENRHAKLHGCSLSRKISVPSR